MMQSFFDFAAKNHNLAFQKAEPKKNIIFA